MFKSYSIRVNQKILLSLSLLCSVVATAQSLTGTLTHHKGQQISVIGFNYYKSEQLAKTTVDNLGNFTLTYPKEYYGIGILKTQDNSSLVLMLTEPDIQLTGTHLQDRNSLSFKNSLTNTNFVQYAKVQSLRNNALSALKYLEDLYQNEPLFANREKLKKTVIQEKAYIQKEEAAFIAKLDPQSHLRWFIPFRKLVQDMPVIVRKETQRIPEGITQFRTTDFNNPKFKTSGLFKELIEGHYMLLENMGQSLDSVNTQMNVSTQYLIDHLQENDSLLNIVADELFTYFEKRSLFKASKYLAVTLLNNTQCSLEENLAAKLESYRKLKVGASAPDIIFKDQQKLSDLKTNKLVVFGASWCPHCTKDIPVLEKYYKGWKEEKVEIIYVSIDTDQAAFQNAYANAPWQVYCDFKGWDTQAAKAYHITGTPSYFLLDENNRILARPNSIEHASVLIDYRL